MAPEMLCKLPLAFMQADYMVLIYSGFTVIPQKKTPFPTIQRVCTSMLKLLNFQIAVLFVYIGLLN